MGTVRADAPVAGRSDCLTAVGPWAGATPIDARILGVYVSLDALRGHHLVKGTTYAKDL
jgi:hypothetical protein